MSERKRRGAGAGASDTDAVVGNSSRDATDAGTTDARAADSSGAIGTQADSGNALGNAGAASVMAHLVLNYPDRAASMEIARGLAEGGAAALELQLPFSDPTADGPLIERACHIALERGATSNDGIEIAGEIAAEVSPIPCYVMSYATIPFCIGVERFVQRIADSGIRGVIVPDLPFDSDEGLSEACATHGIESVIVSLLTVNETRFQAIRALPQQTLYMALRRGITGTETTLSYDHIERLRDLRRAGKRVMAGFGIRSREQISAIAPHTSYAVVGSHFVRLIEEARKQSDGTTTVDYRTLCREAMQRLLSKSPATTR